MASAAVPLLLVILLSPFLLRLSSASALPIAETPSKVSPDEQAAAGAAVGQGCSYTVSIRTSCASPRYTRDRISLAFGDAYRNEVYAPRLDDPAEGTFERCSTDTFRMAGPCGYGVCYLYLYRQGRDGWTPEWVKVVDPYYSGRAVTFYYGSPIPNGIWYGFNNCYRSSSSSSSSSKYNSTAAAAVAEKAQPRDLISEA